MLRKQILLGIFSLLTSYSFAQNEFGSGWVSENQPFSYSFGILNYNFNGLRKNLNKTYPKEFKPFMVTSFGMTFAPILRTKAGNRFDSHFDLIIYHPSDTYSTDTIHHKFTGFHLGYDMCKDLLPYRTKFDILLGGGFNMGWVQYKRIDNINNTGEYYMNPFMTPKLVFEPRWAFGQLVLSFRTELTLDITKKRWRHDPEYTSLPEMNATGYQFIISLGLQGEKR